MPTSGPLHLLFPSLWCSFQRFLSSVSGFHASEILLWWLKLQLSLPTSITLLLITLHYFSSLHLPPPGLHSFIQSVQSLSHVRLFATPWTACSTPGLPVYHQLPEFTQTHVHWVSDAIQLSHALSSPSPPTFNVSQDQSLQISQFFASGGLHYVFIYLLSFSSWESSHKGRNFVLCTCLFPAGRPECSP